MSNFSSVIIVLTDQLFTMFLLNKIVCNDCNHALSQTAQKRTIICTELKIS